MPDDAPKIIAPKIIIDEDWKSQVEAEKKAASSSKPPVSESTLHESPSPEDSPADEDPPMPPASLAMLLSSLATEAMMALGQLPHPATGQLTPRRNQAKYLIDTIEMLREKTLGNVAAEELAGVEQLLHQLRMAFVGMETTPPTASKSAASESLTPHPREETPREET